MSSVEAGVGLKSRGSSVDSENSANYFDAPLEDVALEAFESQLLRLQRTDVGEANAWNPARHSTSSCIGIERENVRWSSMQWRNEKVSFDVADSSFRSEDSEILALWEEKSEGGLDRLGGRRGKAAATGQSKPVGLQSPWRESVSNAVKKIESFSQAMVNNKEKVRGTTWPRCSPIHPKAGVDSPRHSVDKKAIGGRSPWRDFKMMPRNSTESLLHNSPKARYSRRSPCRRACEFESSPSPITAPKLFCQAVTCELQFRSPRPVDFNSRRKYDEREERLLANQENRVSMNRNELKQSCVQANRSSNHREMRKPAIETPSDIPQETRWRATPSNASISRDADSMIAGRALSRQSTKTSLEAIEEALPPRSVEAGVLRQGAELSLKAMSKSMERCSVQSMDEALLNEYASEAGGRAEKLTSGERKASHRYYQRVTSEERSSCWSSSDGNYLDAIDFVAPSAARFLEGSDGCISPVLAPIKTQGAVPFQWEKEPGKPKKDSDSAANQSLSALQLPPRLALSQLKQDPRNQNINVRVSEIDALPNSKPSSSEAQKVQLPRARSNSDRTACADKGSVKVKSRSIGEVRAALHNLSRQSVGYAGNRDSGDQGQCTGSAPQPKPAHVSGKVRPTSPTSILCGPDDGSRPSSNPSLCSEHEAPLNSATLASSLSHCSSPSRASFDSVEHEMMSPESSLTSPLRANSRCNSMAYDDSDSARKEGNAHGGNALVKFYKNGKRWMKSRGHSKLGTILSPEVWAPGLPIRRDEIQESDNFRSIDGKISSDAGRFLHAQPSMEEQRTTSDFSARLEGKGPSPVSKIDHTNVQTDCRFAPALLHEDLGNWSPAYAATLELLSPLQEFSSKKSQKNLLKQSSFRRRKTARRMRVRVKVRARFLVPVRRALRKMLSRCAFRRRHSRKVKAGESKLLYHVDYTISPADFSFSKPT